MKWNCETLWTSSLYVDPRECEEGPALPEDADVLRDEGVDALRELWVAIQ